MDAERSTATDAKKNRRFLDPNQGAFDAEDAAHYLGYDDPRVMDDMPIARVDRRKPGAKKPSWAWRKIDLDTFLTQRLVQPGQASPWEVQ